MRGLMQHRGWLWVLVVAIIAGGVYGTRTLMGNGKERLLERVNLYWEAQRSNDLLTRYHLEVRAATGELWPDEYPRFNEFRTRVLSYAVEGVELSGDMAKVNLIVGWSMPDWNGKSVKQPRQDIWTFYEGDWYHGELKKGDWKALHPDKVSTEPAKDPNGSAASANPANGPATPSPKPLDQPPPAPVADPH